MHGTLTRAEFRDHGWSDMLDRGAARVLLAGPLARARLAESLRGEGYEIVENALSHKLLSHVRTAGSRACEPVDAVVIDLTRQPWRGLSLIEAIRGIDWAMPVIALYGPRHARLAEDLARLGVRALPAVSATHELLEAVVDASPPSLLATAA